MGLGTIFLENSASHVVLHRPMIVYLNNGDYRNVIRKRT